MTQKISDKRQEYMSKQEDDIAPKGKAILVHSYHKEAVSEVIELVHGNQYSVTGRKGTMLNLI